jgi:hypothetical protein
LEPAVPRRANHTLSNSSLITPARSVSRWSLLPM